MSLAYLRLLIFLPAILIPACAFFQPSISHDILWIKVKYAGWKYTALTYPFPDLEPVSFSISSSNCCFLTCIQISQETGQVVVWYSHLLKNFPQLVEIHTVKIFGIVNIAQLVKNLPAMQEIPVWFLGQEDPLGKG